MPLENREPGGRKLTVLIAYFSLPLLAICSQFAGEIRWRGRWW